MTAIYNKELAPWEKKPAYFKNVRFGYMENIQNNFLQIKEGMAIQNETFLKSANSDFITPETRQEALSFLILDDESISEGISGIKASFEWGISDVLWLIEQQRSIFKNLMNSLSKNASSNSTAQFKISAQNAYSKGWFEEALKDYHKVEKRDEADFTVYTSLGIIYLFHLVNKERALEYFQKAGEWARNKSPFYTSYALLFQALIKRDLGEISEAESLTRAAMEKSPDFAAVVYENSLLNAMLDRQDAALQALNKAGALDPRYFLKALADPAFHSCKAKINALVVEAKIRKNQLAETAYRQIQEIMNDINDLTKQFNDKYHSSQISVDLDVVKGIGGGLEEIEKAIARNSLMDFVMVEKFIKHSEFTRLAQQAHKKIYHNIMAKRKEFTRPFEQKIEQVRKRCSLLSSENESGMGQIVLTVFYFGFGAAGAIAALMMTPGMASGIFGAILGFITALAIQFIIKRYGETYEIDYSGYEGYNEIESFVVNLKKIEKKLTAIRI
jgi:tetratricopeptide (TPR) repeat protein